VPYRYRSYDLSFQHWLARTGKHVDTYADEDVERLATSAALRAAYDLLVFPGHTEYVTTRLYDLVEGFRDAGGNLLFLSANNFFRRVDRASTRLALVDEWRDLGRPESALLGNQYIAGDRGERRSPFTVVGADAAPWAFAGTGLTNGSTFGLYEIEIDARSPASPRNTLVLATITDLFGPGRTAEMTYYEHASGARVFSAGALDFGGQVLLWPQTAQLLANVWERLARSG
jgi:N,N-dimethylformamidase beta subunit-like, C-terminal